MAVADRTPENRKIKPSDLRVECQGCGGIGMIVEPGAQVVDVCHVCLGAKLLFPRKVDL
jgi:ribosomal protein S27E